MTTDRPSASLAARRRVAAVAAVLCVLACVSQREPGEAPRGGWWDGDGIVVPHDSFPADCSLCHLPGTWTELREDFEFDHAAETGVALEGAHAEARCLRCHNDRGPVAQFAQRGCAGCHEDVHRGNLGQRCESCHDQQTWVLRDEIAMHNRTRFPLVGAHAAAQCWTCHPGGEVGNWSRVDVDCSTCHLDAALAAPIDHAANGWLTGCDRCHIPTTWDGAGFNHFAFPLDGAHRAADCTACHTGTDFRGLPTDCAGCHAAEYQATTDPDHALAGFPMSCELCHSTSTWEGALFTHAGISSGCVQCHQADYDGAADPDHVAGAFSTSCEECHSTRSWQGALFQHVGIVDGCATCHLDEYQRTTAPDHAATGIPTTCESCHVTSTWLGASFDHAGVTSGCFVCHASDYQGASDPNHTTAGLPTNCEQCHATSTWSPASMNHAGVGSGCVVCHLPDYQATSDPNHAAAGFPSTCETCHGTNTWSGATFNHSFPIQGGDHGGLGCAECHVQPRSYAIFSCIDCHEHNQGDMADKHDDEDIQGYTWTTAACYGCHPNGQAR